MKILTSIFILLSISLQGQTKTLDTIYANDTKNVALFFPEPIRQGITGTSNFVFTYNREKEQYFGLLQATPGSESNLLTVTKNGQVYSYILKYKEQLPNLNYFIATKESIGNERPKLEIRNPIKKSIQENSDKTVYFDKYCKYLLKISNGFISSKQKEGVVLKLLKKVYRSSEVYLVMEIRNKSEIDFEVDYLNIYRVNGNKKRKASYQRLEQEVIHQYKMPSQVKTGEGKRFVYVLPKFVLGDNEKLEIELREFKGSRRLHINH